MKRKKPESSPESGEAVVTGSSDVSPSKSPSFEESFATVEGAVERLESGDLTLEDSLREYERGLASLNRCYEVLKQAQRRIEVLGGTVGSVVEGASAPEWKPGASHGALGETIEAVEREEGLPGEP